MTMLDDLNKNRSKTIRRMGVVLKRAYQKSLPLEKRLEYRLEFKQLRGQLKGIRNNIKSEKLSRHMLKQY
jgi:hypothetical protein